MRCPNCEFENPANAAFCMNCGTKLSRACTRCGQPLPPGAKFCMNCGQPVEVVTPADVARHTRLSAASPAPLAEKMRAAHLSGERKLVTALFADVAGSTALAEGMDPEDWTAIMNRAFDVMSPAVHRYEGTIARVMGDAILAFFGAPVAHEDDPERAVRAALDMLAAMDEYGQELKRAYGIEFRIRVGLNTGPVVVGDVGSDLKYEYTAMGDAINIAARMQSAAAPGAVLIAEPTYRLIAAKFDVKEQGPQAIKGKAEPVRADQVVGLKARPGRVRGIAGLESPMVGRDFDLARLQHLVGAVRAGRGRMAVVTGEPGIGKTRLIAEWHAWSQRADARIAWAEGHCLSYGKGLAYHLLLDLLRSLLGVPAAAGEPETRVALQARLQDALGDGWGEVYPYLGHLFSMQLDEATQERLKYLDAQAMQQQYLAALRRFLRALAERGPLVLICDDIHWADPSSVEFLTRLMPLVNEAPVLLAFATRPDREAHGWKLVTAARDLLGEGLTEIHLAALSEEDSRRLVSNLLEIESLPSRIRDVILQKSEGNPFFVEEVIRMLMDRGAIVRQNDRWVATEQVEGIAIPSTLQGLLLARIDRLPDDVKRTLRVASVIGRQFPVRVLEKVLEQQA